MGKFHDDQLLHHIVDEEKRKLLEDLRGDDIRQTRLLNKLIGLQRKKEAFANNINQLSQGGPQSEKQMKVWLDAFDKAADEEVKILKQLTKKTLKAVVTIKKDSKHLWNYEKYL